MGLMRGLRDSKSGICWRLTGNDAVAFPTRCTWNVVRHLCDPKREGKCGKTKGVLSKDASAALDLGHTHVIFIYS